MQCAALVGWRPKTSRLTPYRHCTTLIFAGARDSKKNKEHFGAKKVNTTFVIDREGKLIYRGGFGVKDEKYVQNAVKAALEGKAAPESDKKFAG